MVEGRKQAIQAARLLNGFVGDLVASAQVRRRYKSQAEHGRIKRETYVLVNRLCLTEVFLVLAKWLEFYDHFHRLIPNDCREACRDLRKDIRRRKVVEFRNKYVGHIWDNDRDRPLTNQEIDELVNTIVDGDQESSIEWCAAQGAEFPNSVGAIIEHTRDRIEEEYSLTEAEIFP